jgi:hypothetical protein
VDDVYARRRTLCAGGERVAATSKQGLLALDRRKVSLAVKLSYGIACGMGSLFLRPNGGAGPAGWVNSAPRLCRSSIVPCRGGIRWPGGYRGEPSRCGLSRASRGLLNDPGPDVSARAGFRAVSHYSIPTCTARLDGSLLGLRPHTARHCPEKVVTKLKKLRWKHDLQISPAAGNTRDPRSCARFADFRSRSYIRFDLEPITRHDSRWRYCTMWVQRPLPFGRGARVSLAIVAREDEE